MSAVETVDSQAGAQQELPFAMVYGQAVMEMPLDLYIPPDALEVFLEAFEGPLDLLLYLIRKQNINILDIPVAEITRQYMGYVELMQSVRLELAAEYLVMAAMLAEIKSRMLLPRSETVEAEEDDPRAELIRRLQEYERFKAAAEGIDGLSRVGRDVVVPKLDAPEARARKLLPDVSLEELLMSMAEVLRRGDMFEHHQVSREALSTRERMSDVLERLKGGGFVPFVELFTAEEGRLGVVVTFMAILELVKESLVELVQNEPFAAIHVRARAEERAESMTLTEPRELAPLLEAFLLASGKPQSLERLFELFEEAERPEPPVFKKALEILRKSCDGRAFELREVASGYRLQIREKFSPWVGRLWEERPQRYSRAMLETMALIAYRQPITRGEIEDVRGVAVNSHIVKTLLEREWIRIVGYRDVPGKPAMFATTKVFLDHFNLKNLDDLPPLAELREMETEPVLDFDDAPVPASLQELADATAEPEEPKDETSFHTLLLELDDMEQGIKTDFDDLLRDGAVEPDAQEQHVEGAAEVEIEIESEPEPEPEPEEDILGVAEAREKLLAAVAALEQPPLSDEEDEARALAEAIEAERRQFED
jgi:segregation and condensation protein B